MWDPRTYEDTDYGLDDGESFEPDFDPNEDEPFDPAMPHVMTILGPIEPEELGVCLPATRFMPQPSPDQTERERARFLAEAGEELEAFASVGGRGIVDIATAETGRDVPALQRLTQLVPSHIIASTSPDGLSDDDLDRASVRPGLIVAHLEAVAAADRIERAIEGAFRHGMPLLITVPSWDRAAAMLAARRRVVDGMTAAPRLVLGGPEGLPDLDTIEEAGNARAFVTIRCAGPGHPHDEALLAERIVDVGNEGLAAHLLVTMDIVVPRLRLAVPAEPRTPYLIDRFALALMDAGASALDVRRLLVENPAEALTIRRPIA
ncbi:MAG: hypothetical protein QM753_07185 [Thermomicrobiales bacterium]